MLTHFLTIRFGGGRQPGLAQRMRNPLSQTRLRTAQMAAHELLIGQIPVICIIRIRYAGTGDR